MEAFSNALKQPGARRVEVSNRLITDALLDVQRRDATRTSPPRVGLTMAEEAMEHFRAVCARTRDTVARNAKFNGSVERLFDVERRLGGNAVAALDASTLADLGEAPAHG